MMLEQFHDFLRYIRFEICIFSAFIAASGYLLNNPLSGDLFFVVLASFFVCAGAYSYNNTTDRKEDIINRKRTNRFASSVQGKYITIAAFLVGFVSSLFLPRLSVLFGFIAIAISVIYSSFRLKEYLFVKNIYTGFGVTQFFLIGAAASPITAEIMRYYIMLSLFILIESVISDLRDYKGDRKCGIKTLPVYFGYGRVRSFVLLMIAIYSISILWFTKLLVLLPFVVIMFLAIRANKPSFAHHFGSYSLLFLAPSMAI